MGCCPGFQAFCVACQEGTYNLQINSKCLPCPIGAICKGGDSLTADTGYWQLQVGLPFYPDPDAVDYGSIRYEPEFFRCRAAPYVRALFGSSHCATADCLPRTLRVVQVRVLPKRGVCRERNQPHAPHSVRSEA